MRIYLNSLDVNFVEISIFTTYSTMCMTVDSCTQNNKSNGKLKDQLLQCRLKELKILTSGRKFEVIVDQLLQYPGHAEENPEIVKAG